MMKITDARKMSGAEIAALLKKKAFDECNFEPQGTARCNGNVWCTSDSSPSGRDRIVNEVRHGGDEKLLYYTNLLDKANLTADKLRVTEKEFDEAQDPG
jgi:histidinol dehydrogenase